MIRFFVIAFLLLTFNQFGIAQNSPVTINASNQPLNELLLQLRDQYDFKLSYSDIELSKYQVSVSKTFPTKEAALRFLLKDLPFDLQISGEVFIIILNKKKQRELNKPPSASISGQIVESGTFEPLSYSNIIVNKHQIVSDATGSFNYTASADSTFHIRISHLGYYVFDTVLYAGMSHKFKLVPSTEKLPEVTVTNNLVEKATQIGEKSGNMKLNHNISRFLPGQGDNSVFNLLRLMPGVQAADEQTSDVLMWGSYEGQSLITFDHFTLFGLKNYNSNISIVNPFVVKNIEIYKGGFEAKYGNRVGGFVDITGKNGTLQKPTFSFNINPTTLNGMVEVPLFKRSSLLLAYRQTYYNLYNLKDFNIFAPTRPVHGDEPEPSSDDRPNVNLSVYPDSYRFRDFNAKYTYNFANNDQFSVSFYAGGDKFRLTTASNLIKRYTGEEGEETETPYKFFLSDDEKNSQLGFSANYTKYWADGNLSRLIVSHSDFSKIVLDYSQTKDPITGEIYSEDDVGIENEVYENSVRLENIMNFREGHQIEFGGGVYSNEAYMENLYAYKDAPAVNATTDITNIRSFIYMQDRLNLNGRLDLKSGLRISLAGFSPKLLFEPRLSATYRLSESLKLNASWGRYYQFMYKLATVDRDNNYTYLWMTGKRGSPVLNATHWIGGINYFNKNFTVNIEGYYRTTGNLSRQVLRRQEVNGEMTNVYNMLRGDAKVYGVDTYIKKDFGKHSVWASYTLSQALERLALRKNPLPAYSAAPQDQRHELKLAGLINVGRFYFSANYIYGSGMQIIKETFGSGNDRLSYKRTDVALTYNFNSKKLSGETGLSILNIFDTRNLVHNNFKNIDINDELGSVRIYTNAVPFTPVLFFKVVF